jgi:hypothetical protein
MESKTVSIDIPYIGGNNRLSESELNMQIDRYIANLRSAGEQWPEHTDIVGFFKLVQNILEAKQNSESVPEDKRLLVLAEDPPEEVDTEAVTFVLVSRTPGQFSKGSIGEGKVRELTGHVRSIQQHPEHPGEKLVTVGKLYDNNIVFSVYARSDVTALKRALWLSKTIDSYKWYFRVHGIPIVLEDAMGARERVMIGNLAVTRYPISYFVRTEDTYQFGSQELKHVELNFNLE